MNIEVNKVKIFVTVPTENIQEVRNSIKRLGGTMPEELLTPDKSLKESEKENKKLKE